MLLGQAGGGVPRALGPPQKPTQELAAGRTVKREVGADEVDRYEVELNEGQYLRIGIEANGGAVTVALYDPAGRKLTEAARGPDVIAPEPVAAVSQLAGKYTVVVRGAGPASYELSVEELRPAAEHDGPRVAAERAAARAAALQITKGDPGSLRAALKLYEEAQSSWRAAGERRQEARALASVAGVYISLGDYAAAVGKYEAAAVLFEQLGLDREEAAARENIGWLCYESLRDAARALPHLERALRLHGEAGRRHGEARARRIVGMVYAGLGSTAGERRKAFAYLDVNVAQHRAAGDRYSEGDELSNLMVAWKNYGRPREAIFYGKQAVNVYQSLRAGLKSAGLEADTQKTFLKSKEDAYRTLAELLIEAGRLPEAQLVLAMLKEQEYFEFVRRDPSSSAVTARATLTPEEATLEAEYVKLADEITRLGRQRGELFSKKGRTDEEEKLLGQLEDQLAVASEHFHKFLEALQVKLGVATAQGARVTEIKDALGMQKTLRELGDGAVLLYTLVGGDHYRVMLVTPDTQQAYENPIKAADLARKVLAFREALQAPQKDPAPLARELHTILVGPKLARDLEQAGAKTLMWSLDGVLRYLPVAALQDEAGKYLVETYRNTIFTPASRDRLKDPVAGRWTALGAGVSKGKEVMLPGVVNQRASFTALPGVPRELRSVVRDKSAGAEAAAEGDGVLEGKVMLDEGFTKDSLRAALRQQYQLVHIASHFRFQPGNESHSFLLLGGEDDQSDKLTVAEIKRVSFEGVDLLTLSACETALGGGKSNGIEVESFGVLAQRQGAGAVLATLWPVADASAPLVMREFYRLREAKPGMGKAEALRQAQLYLLRGGKASGDGAPASHGGAGANRGLAGSSGVAGSERRKSFAHPFFWAPFVMIGNWK